MYRPAYKCGRGSAVKDYLRSGTKEVIALAFWPRREGAGEDSEGGGH
jgi:hypothetical protein